MKESIVFDKSKGFALRIIALYKYLCDEKKEFILSKQLLRSGTSIGANIAEASCAYSSKEFLAKMYIAFKECAETAYWLELLYKAQYYFKGKYVKVDDVPTLIDDEKANVIEFYLIQNGYVDMKRKVTDKYRQDVKNGTVAELPEELKPMTDGIPTMQGSSWTRRWAGAASARAPSCGKRPS